MGTAIGTAQIYSVRLQAYLQQPLLAICFHALKRFERGTRDRRERGQRVAARDQRRQGHL